jgi:hypothetical protein
LSLGSNAATTVLGKKSTSYGGMEVVFVRCRPLSKRFEGNSFFRKTIGVETT